MLFAKPFNLFLIHVYIVLPIPINSITCMNHSLFQNVFVFEVELWYRYLGIISWYV